MKLFDKLFRNKPEVMLPVPQPVQPDQPSAFKIPPSGSKPMVSLRNALRCEATVFGFNLKELRKQTALYEKYKRLEITDSKALESLGEDVSEKTKYEGFRLVGVVSQNLRKLGELIESMSEIEGATVIDISKARREYLKNGGLERSFNEAKWAFYKVAGFKEERVSGAQTAKEEAKEEKLPGRDLH